MRYRMVLGDKNSMQTGKFQLKKTPKKKAPRRFCRRSRMIWSQLYRRLLSLMTMPTKRELAEACIVASAKAIVTLNCVLSSNDVVAVLNRLLLLTGDVNYGNDEEDKQIPGYLIWVLNKQFENGVEIQSSTIAVLAASEILEMMAQEISKDILPEDVNSAQRSWCTLTSFLLRFSLPRETHLTDLEDLRRWLVQHLSKRIKHQHGEIVDDKASQWMSNLFHFTQFMAALALDAVDMNDQYAIYYATISAQTLKSCGTVFCARTSNQCWVGCGLRLRRRIWKTITITWKRHCSIQWRL